MEIVSGGEDHAVKIWDIETEKNSVDKISYNILEKSIKSKNTIHSILLLLIRNKEVETA